MLHRALDDPNIYNFEAACATELLGDLSRKAGNRDEAEARYRHVLTIWPALNGTAGSVEISLAKVWPKSRTETRPTRRPCSAPPERP